MENNEAIIVQNLCKKYCKNERFIILLLKICKDNDMNYSCIEKELRSVYK